MVCSKSEKGNGTCCRPCLSMLLVLLMAMIAGGPAFAVQFSEDFSNSAYDGSYDSTKWWGTVSGNFSTPGSVVQDGATNAMILTTGESAWPDCVQLGSKGKVSIASSAPNKGTNFEFTINNLTATTISPSDTRVNINSSTTFTFMLAEDTETTTAGYANYERAAMGIMFHVGNETNMIGIEGWSGNRNEFLGSQPIFHAVSVTYPLKVNLIMNEKYFVLKFNDVQVAAGATLMNPAIFQHMVSPRFILEGLNKGRGNMSFTNFTVSDADAAAISEIPTVAPNVFSIEDNFDTAFGATYLPVGVGKWKNSDVERTGGKLIMTTPPVPDNVFAGDLSEAGICTAELPFVDGSEATLSADLLSVEDLSGNFDNTIFTMSILTDVACTPYERQGSAGYHNAYINAEGGNTVTFWQFGKGRFGGWGAQTDTGNSDDHNRQTINFPAHIEIKVDNTNYTLKVNDKVISAKAHGAVFDQGHVAAMIMSRSNGNGQTKVAIDNLKFSVTPVNVVNAAQNWAVYN